MALADKLRTIKTNLSSLLTYANGVTGKADVSIGEAVRSLADGYGGGGGADISITTVTPTTENHYIEVGGDKIPDLMFILPVTQYTESWRDCYDISNYYGKISGVYWSMYPEFQLFSDSGQYWTLDCTMVTEDSLSSGGRAEVRVPFAYSRKTIPTRAYPSNPGTQIEDSNLQEILTNCGWCKHNGNLSVIVKASEQAGNNFAAQPYKVVKVYGLFGTNISADKVVTII